MRRGRRDLTAAHTGDVSQKRRGGGSAAAPDVDVAFLGDPTKDRSYQKSRSSGLKVRASLQGLLAHCMLFDWTLVKVIHIRHLTKCLKWRTFTT